MSGSKNISAAAITAKNERRGACIAKAGLRELTGTPSILLVSNPTLINFAA